jgi:hypothetical protein
MMERYKLPAAIVASLFGAAIAWWLIIELGALR